MNHCYSNYDMYSRKWCSFTLPFIIKHSRLFMGNVYIVAMGTAYTPCHGNSMSHAIPTTSKRWQQPPNHAMPTTSDPHHGNSLRAMPWQQPIRHAMATTSMPCQQPLSHGDNLHATRCQQPPIRAMATVSEPCHGNSLYTTPW